MIEIFKGASKVQIFVLDKNPKKAAVMLCDHHVVKMLLESAQILCSPHDANSAPYKRTHYNHPCVKWARESSANYLWLLQHALAISEEYKLRYEKRHKSSAVIHWCGFHFNELEFPENKITPFAQAIPDIYKSPDPVMSYRSYYIGEKGHFATWKKGRRQPRWWISNHLMK